jgi:hypothetical protein
MAVAVKMVDGVIQFHPDAGDEGLADYLCTLVREAKRLGESADPGVLAKSGLTGIAFIRHAQESKIAALEAQAEVWSSRADDWSLAKDIRDLNGARASRARAEARAIRDELGAS